MEYTDGILKIESFLSATLGLIVLFAGRGLNQRFRLLQDYNIPEPVTGGLLFSLLFALIYFTIGIEVVFDLARRDVMLVYFFTIIGINSRFQDLLLGGKPLAILLAATVGYMFIQNLTGVSIATAFGLPPQVGMLGGTVSLIGGHGTAIAWAPTFAEDYGITNAMEIAVACATFGLILASLMGGPIANYLIKRHHLQPAGQDAQPDVGMSIQEEQSTKIDYTGFIHALLAIHLSIIIGFLLNETLAAFNFKLPLFVTCLFAGILISNTLPTLLPNSSWPARTPAIALIAEVSLGIFLAMSLMSMQLWVVVDLAGPILTILLVQFMIAASLAIFLIFRLMGSNYDAAVVCAGFGGISLGSTATAMANMTAVAQRYGNSHLAFIIVPLVAAFFVDLVNAVMIKFFLAYL